MNIPRIGATDVVPFVPISDVSMQECVELSRRLGKRVAEKLEHPRVSLRGIRRYS